jgi:hypothetical protein
MTVERKGSLQDETVGPKISEPLYFMKKDSASCSELPKSIYSLTLDRGKKKPIYYMNINNSPPFTSWSFYLKIP